MGAKFSALKFWLVVFLITLVCEAVLVTVIYGLVMAAKGG
jgi:hypothetical protein